MGWHRHLVMMLPPGLDHLSPREPVSSNGTEQDGELRSASVAQGMLLSDLHALLP